MRRMLPLAMVLLVLVGCPRPTTSASLGAATSEMAILDFLGATRAQNIQGVSDVWGNADGPTRELIKDREEVERRILIMMRVLCHDESAIGPAQAADGGRTEHRVDLTYQGRKTTVPFFTVRNKNTGRWFVEDIDLRPVRDFCSGARTATPPRS